MRRPEALEFVGICGRPAECRKYSPGGFLLITLWQNSLEQRSMKCKPYAYDNFHQNPHLIARLLPTTLTLLPAINTALHTGVSLTPPAA